MMVVKASDKQMFCDDDDERGLVSRKDVESEDDDGMKLVSRENVESESEDDDDDDIPLSQGFPGISSLRMCSSKHDASVEKMDTATLPVKRVFGNNNSLCGSLKKSKVTTTLDDDNNDNDDDDVPISPRIKRSAVLTDKSISSLKKTLELVENSFDECRRIRKVEKKKLQSIKRDIEECSKELENKKKEIHCVERINEAQKKMQGKIEECVKDLVIKEGQLHLMNDLIGELKQELNMKELELLQVMDKISEQKQVPELVNDLVSKQNHFESRMEELKSKEKQLEGKMKEHQSKESKFECQVKELESEKKHFQSRLKELESKEQQFKGQMKEFQSKEEEFKGQVKQFESNKEEFKGRIKKLESLKKTFESQVDDFKLKEKQFEGQWKELESKEKKFNIRVNELELKEKQFEGQVKDHKSKLDKFDGQLNEPESTKKQCEPLIICLDEEEEFEKELEVKEKQIEGQVMDPESKLGKFDGQLNEPESTKKQCEPLIICLDEEEEFESCTDNELSLAIDETSLQWHPSDKTDILADLLESSNPAKMVLDIIQNPSIPHCKRGNAVIIDESQIFLLEQLMKISPNIKPCVRQNALKLALDLKANMKENTENSLLVFGFLLLLSIYGLVTYFNEDELLELLAIVSQHKIAVEMFGTLGFGNKVSDFVENLVRRKQFESVVHVTWPRRINKFLCSKLETPNVM